MMTSRDSPKKKDQGKDVQKQGALDACVTELCTSLQETMAQGEMSGQESSVTGTLATRHRTVPGRSAPTNGIRHQDSYCLLVRVIKDALGLSEWDIRVPTHAWDENIAADICESWIGCPPGTYKVQLLSDTEFLGMTGFFRRFIKNYTPIAKPLNDILEGEASKMKSEAITLPPEALEAFEWLKMCCMTAPILAFADFEKEFQLETDASSEGLGTVLSQKQPDGKWHPVAFGSRDIKGGEAKYHSLKLEFLALKWAIMEQFREYLRYRPFTVLTDNNLLTYILMTPNLDTLGHQWVAALASYNMTIRYLKGSDNKVADALSQIETRLDPETVTELLNHTKGGAPQAEAEDIWIIEEEERADQEVILRPTKLARQDKKFCNLHTEDWRQAQQMDLVIPHVLEWLQLPKNDRIRLKDFL